MPRLFGIKGRPGELVRTGSRPADNAGPGLREADRERCPGAICRNAGNLPAANHGVRQSGKALTERQFVNVIEYRLYSRICGQEVRRQLNSLVC